MQQQVLGAGQKPITFSRTTHMYVCMCLDFTQPEPYMVVDASNFAHLFISRSKKSGFFDFRKKWFLESLNFFFSKSIIFRCLLVKPTSFMVGTWNFAHLLTSGSKKNIFLRFFENVLFAVSKKNYQKVSFFDVHMSNPHYSWWALEMLHIYSPREVVLLIFGFAGDGGFHIETRRILVINHRHLI